MRPKLRILLTRVAYSNDNIFPQRRRIMVSQVISGLGLLYLSCCTSSSQLLWFPMRSVTLKHSSAPHLGPTAEFMVGLIVCERVGVGAASACDEKARGRTL